MKSPHSTTRKEPPPITTAPAQQPRPSTAKYLCVRPFFSPCSSQAQYQSSMETLFLLSRISGIISLTDSTAQFYFSM